MSASGGASSVKSPIVDVIKRVKEESYYSPPQVTADQKFDDSTQWKHVDQQVQTVLGSCWKAHSSLHIMKFLYNKPQDESKWNEEMVLAADRLIYITLQLLAKKGVARFIPTQLRGSMCV